MTVTATGREIPHPAIEEIRLEGVLHALSDPVRLMMVCDLANAPQGEGLPCASFDVPVSKSTATHHFKVLREAGVIRQVYSGTARLSSLRIDDLETLFPGLLERMLNAAEQQERRGS